MKNPHKKPFILLLFYFCYLPLPAQPLKKSITLEDIWQKSTFATKSVYGIDWMKNGMFYTSQVHNDSLDVDFVIRYEILSGKIKDTLLSGLLLKQNPGDKPVSIESYQWNEDETKALISTEGEQIYRRSYKYQYYIYDLITKKITNLSKNGKALYATFSPNGKKAAYVRDNNLFVFDLDGETETQISSGGEFNKIINGACDWVYEEEFEFAQAYQWSPTNERIAFYQFDERQVKEFSMDIWGDLFPGQYRFKYPKAGEKNSIVTIFVYDIQKGTTLRMETGDETDQYIPRIKWTKNPTILSILRMNRLQNKLEILLADAVTGKTNVVYSESTNTYIEINDNLTFLDDRKSFLYSSDKDGYRHLYLYDMEKKTELKLTSGNWEIDEISGIDEKNQKVYFISTESSPVNRDFYSLNFTKPKKPIKTKLNATNGTVTVSMNPDFSFYIENFSNANSPTVITLRTQDGNKVRALEENATLNKTMTHYSLSKKEFFTFRNQSGVELNGWMIKPVDFNPEKKYPVLMNVYGGPGKQTVLNEWEGKNYFWEQLLAQKGYVLVSVDNRGTKGRGAEFLKSTYKQLGKLELEDQKDAAKYLAGHSYIDKDRIGIWGWSYGGYMSSLCITLGSDVFKMAIAVAPVTSWRFYDTIYSERFLQLPKDNPSGYDDYSPLTHADKLNGKFLLIHGTSDDNVHFQNSMEFQTALIKAGKHIKSFFYPNKNHGIYGGNTRLHLYVLLTEFIEGNL